jgi:UPF0716 protein FxsA
LRGKTLAIAIGWPLVEVVTAVAVAGQIGWGTTILLLCAFSLLGVFVLRAAVRHTKRTLQTVAAGTMLPPGTAGDAGLRYLAGVLLLIPGFVSDGVGLLLLIPGVRAMLGVALGVAVAKRAPEWAGFGTQVRLMTPPGDVVRGDVVTGDVVTDDVVPPTDPSDRDDQPPALPS